MNALKAKERLLTVPSVFDTWQWIVGAQRAKRWFVTTQLLRVYPRRVLEIGCGTGALCPWLPTDVDYLGVDLDGRYIEAARNRFPDRRFVVADVTHPDFHRTTETFDAVVAFGLLHHLDDQQVRQTLRSSAQMLRPGGWCFAVEPCLAQGSGLLERLLMAGDRGGHIRTAAGYRELMLCNFPEVEVETHADRMNVRFTLSVLRARGPN